MEEKDIDRIVSELSFDEKINLLSGTNFMETKKIDRLNIPSYIFSDGPNGLRVQVNSKNNGTSDSEISTAFPPASTIANSFEPNNSYLIGKEISKQAKHYHIDMVLGPSINLVRNPLGGRNFEYFSEDPYLTSRFAVNEILGLQENGTAACVKHYCLNNLEEYRFNGNSIASKRTINELYLRAFKACVEEASVKAVMTSYNMVNGTYMSENETLVKDTLIDKWKFNGMIISDWGGIHDRSKALKAGLDLEMPGDVVYSNFNLKEAYKNGEISTDDINRSVKKVLQLALNKKVEDEKLDLKSGAKIAYETAIDSAVLLKNNGVLPLKTDNNILVIGSLFESMRYQGAGSSSIKPNKVIQPIDAFNEAGILFKYVKGYSLSSSRINRKLEKEAVLAAKKHKTILFFAGLNEFEELESGDRASYFLGKNQVSLIKKLLRAKVNLILVLFGGSSFAIPEIESPQIKACLNMFLPGEQGGKACFDLIFGKVSPSGRLGRTWYKDISDVPFYQEFNSSKIARYKEDIYLGYRYTATFNVKPLFPFGYGLSYGDFKYSNYRVNLSGKSIEVSVDVASLAPFENKDVIQIYSSKADSNISRPIRSLIAFKKVSFSPLEKKTVNLTIPLKELEIYSSKLDRFVLEKGKYSIVFALNADHVVYESSIDLDGVELEDEKSIYSFNLNISDGEFDKYVSCKGEKEDKKICLDSRFIELKHSKLGWLFYYPIIGCMKVFKALVLLLNHSSNKSRKLKEIVFLIKSIQTITLNSLVMNSSGRVQRKTIEALADFSNGNILKAIKDLRKKEK